MYDKWFQSSDFFDFDIFLFAILTRVSLWGTTKIFLTALESQKSKAEDKLRDEIRTLHEAYQFLSRKYIKLAETLGQMNQEELEAYAKKKEEERKGQAHDIFSRIFQIRIYEFILPNIM